jgi:hypothetical protein
VSTSSHGVSVTEVSAAQILSAAGESGSVSAASILTRWPPHSTCRWKRIDCGRVPDRTELLATAALNKESAAVVSLDGTMEAGVSFIFHCTWNLRLLFCCSVPFSDFCACYCMRFRKWLPIS